jgi:hypothetical protein
MPATGANAVNHSNEPKPIVTVVKSMSARGVRMLPPSSTYSSANARAASG